MFIFYFIIRLIVLVLPHIVPFSFGDTAIHSGQATQVTCLISEGDIPLEFTWSFEGSNANSLAEIATTKVGTKGSLLFIDSVTEDQAGNYTCTVSNRAGSVFYIATLNVYGIQMYCSISRKSWKCFRNGEECSFS